MGKSFTFSFCQTIVVFQRESKVILYMPSEQKSEKQEKRILWLSFLAGLILAVSELIFAVYSHSHSSLMDAVYDSTELIFIALILFLTPLFHQSISEERPYGFFQIESIFLIIKGFMMLSVTLTASTNIIQSALSGGNPVDGRQVSFFQLLLGLVCIAVYWLMRRMNRHVASPTVDAELLGWRLDIGYSIGLSFSFFLSTFLDRTPLARLAPYFDPAVAVLIVVFMLPENIRMLVGAIRDVFLFSPDEELLEQVKTLSQDTLDRFHFTPIFYDVTRTGRRLWISIYFTTQDNVLKLDHLRHATAQLHQALGTELENFSCELIPKQQEEDGFLLPSPDESDEPEIRFEDDALATETP